MKNMKGKGSYIPPPDTLFLPSFSIYQFSLLSLSLFSILLLISFLHLFSPPSSFPFSHPFLCIPIVFPYSLYLLNSFFLLSPIFLLIHPCCSFVPFLLRRSIPPPRKIKGARFKGFDLHRNYAIFLKMKYDSP